MIFDPITGDGAYKISGGVNEFRGQGESSSMEKIGRPLAVSGFVARLLDHMRQNRCN